MTVKNARPLKCDAGAILFRPEDACPGFVIVKGGSIRVSLTAANGREIVLYRVHPGDVCLQTFSCLIEGRKYSAEGIVETDLDAEIISPSDFREKLATDAGFRENIFQAVAHRFADFEQLVEDVALSGFDRRLARALLRLAGSQDVVQATHESLAVETGSGRAVVSRQLGEFSRQALVSLSRGEIRLLNRERLEALAG
ncbi:helix-turn-helix domain-containing protein [bacterium]|nr:helix-turn-helix domain-containing protein [bacterium]